MLFRKSPEQLMSEAEQALEQLDFRKASQIADQLLRMHHTSGFEYKARALWGMNRPQDAIAVLQRGVAVARKCGFCGSIWGTTFWTSGGTARRWRCFGTAWHATARLKIASSTTSRLCTNAWASMRTRCNCLTRRRERFGGFPTPSWKPRVPTASSICSDTQRRSAHFNTHNARLTR